MDNLSDMQQKERGGLPSHFPENVPEHGPVRIFLTKCFLIIGAIGCFSISFFLLTAAMYWVLGDYLQFQEGDDFSYSGPGLLLSNSCILAAGIISLLVVAGLFKKLRDLAKPGVYSWDPIHIAKGFIGGFGMITIPFLIVLLLGMVSIDGITFDIRKLIYSLLVLLLAAAFEEVLCRSFLLELIRSFFGAWTGVVLSALIFSVGHLANDNISIVPMLELLIAGFVLGVFYVKYGLGAAIAFHFIWNFIQGPIYGFKISGTEGYHLLELYFSNQNDIFSGIHFGLEGTVWAVFVGLFYLVFVIYQDGFTLGDDGIESNASADRA